MASSTEPGTPQTAPLVMVETWQSEHSAELAALITGRMVHRLPPPGKPLPRRVSDWVEHHHAALQQLNLQPPFVVGGWSFGGVVALELARLLEGNGTPAAHVLMLDCLRPNLRPIRVRDAVMYHLSEAALIPDPPERSAYLKLQTKVTVYRKIRQHPWGRRFLLRLQPAAPPPPQKPADPLTRAIHRSYLNYFGRPVRFPVSIFATLPSIERAVGDPSLRWSQYLQGGFDVTPIGGSHFGMWESPHIESLARSVADRLGRLGL